MAAYEAEKKTGSHPMGAKMRSFALSAWMLIILGGCAGHATGPQPQGSAFQPPGSYDQAVRDASVPERGEISHDLTAISRENEGLVWDRERTRLLVVTWKSRVSYERYLRPNARTSPDEVNVVWVTAAPEVQRFCRNRVRQSPDITKAALDLRLKQYLGLNAAWDYDLFVELWVSPEDLFRPCVDPEIGDSACKLAFDDPAPAVTGIADYPAFYKNLYYKSFRSEPGVPWTGLGYTYDWGSQLTKEGASEFILRPGAPYAVREAIPTTAYCTPEGGT